MTLRVWKDDQVIDEFEQPGARVVNDPDGVTLHIMQGDEVLRTYKPGEWHSAGHLVERGRLIPPAQR